MSDKVEPYYRAGDLKFRDLDGDNIISKGDDTAYDAGDREIIGNETPRYMYSFRLGADWNGIDLGIFFQGVGKRDWYPIIFLPVSGDLIPGIYELYSRELYGSMLVRRKSGGYFPVSRLSDVQRQSIRSE